MVLFNRNQYVVLVRPHPFRYSAVPMGLRHRAVIVPAMNCRAIFGCPHGTLVHSILSFIFVALVIGLVVNVVSNLA